MGRKEIDSRTRVRTPSASAEGKHPGVPSPEGVLGSRPGLQARVLDWKAVFAAAALLLCALLLAYFLLPRDSPDDGRGFYSMLVSSGRVGLLYDVRGADGDAAQTAAIYQCGVDIISKGRFAGKTIVNIACDSESCLSVSTGSNGSNRMSFEQALRKFDGTPYILIRAGGPSYSFYQRHMEISIGKGQEGVSCDISATEE